MDKFLYYPLKRPMSVNQPFGANYNTFYAEANMLGHGGIDFRAVHGQPIYAAHDGVCYPRIDSHGGNGVVLRGDTYQTIYWHMIDDDAVVESFQQVKAGDLLGYCDSTGQSTGDHLHFGFRFNNTPIGNGYGGYLDPQPYFIGKYAEEINNPVQPPPPHVFYKTLKYGMWNSEVHELQLVLTSQGLYTALIDGQFGPKTLVSVKQFQINHELLNDGICGPKTNAILNSI